MDALKRLEMRMEILHALVAHLYANHGSHALGGPGLERALDGLRRRYAGASAEFEQALRELMVPIQEPLDRNSRDTGGT